SLGAESDEDQSRLLGGSHREDVLRQDRLPAGTEAPFDGEPGLLEDDLHETDEQADEQAEQDERERPARDAADDDGDGDEEDAAEEAADESADQAVADFFPGAVEQPFDDADADADDRQPDDAGQRVKNYHDTGVIDQRF